MDSGSGAATRLFSPIALRGVSVRNRVVISPMQQFMATDGIAGDWHLVHLGQFAMGGAGIVFTEATAVAPEGRISYGDLCLWSEAQADAQRRLASFIRSTGAVPAIQICHAGRRAGIQRPWDGKEPLGAADAARGEPPWPVWGPSPLPCRPAAPTPIEMDAAMIETAQAAYVQAARLAHRAGFDILELHGGHGYLIHAFLSPLANRRVDRYGGDRASRMRFAIEVAQRVRDAWPPEKPLFFRISAIDGVEGGWSIEDTIVLVRQLMRCGVDVIDVSSGGLSGLSSNASVHARRPGYHVPLAARIHAETGARTQVVGLITEAEQAEAILQSGAADLVALARAALHDPFWAAHADERLGDTQFKTWPDQYGWWLRARRRLLNEPTGDIN